MAIERSGNFLGSQRIDIPHIRSIESSICADFDVGFGRILAGDKALIVRGFTIANTLSIPANTVQLSVTNGTVMHPNASEAGTIYAVPSDRTVEILSPSNARVEGAFVAGCVNYVSLDLIRSADSSTADLVSFIEATTELEITQTIPLARTLDYKIHISNINFSATANLCPIAKITTDSNNLVTAIVDARNLAYRLGIGGDFPSIYHTYSWPQGRLENILTGDIFTGGDKGIVSNKDWSDAVMTRLWEIGGGQFWYSAVADRNVKLVRRGAPFPSSEYFTWTAGNLQWKGLAIVFPNSPGTINAITNSTAGYDLIIGDCVYVDIDYATNATLTVQKAAYATLGTADAPYSRYILAWCVDDGAGNPIIYVRDDPWQVGGIPVLAPATTVSNGIVTLNYTPVAAPAPVVTVVNAAGQVVATGLTRDGIGAGDLTIGNFPNDTSVTIGQALVDTTINGTLKVDLIDKNALTYITSNTGIKATASLVGGNGLEGIGNGVGSGGKFTSGALGVAVEAKNAATDSNYANILSAVGEGTRTIGGIDYMGFPLYDPPFQFRENWMRPISLAVSGSTDDKIWYATMTGALSFAKSQILHPVPIHFYRYTLLNCGTANNDYIYFFSGDATANEMGIVFFPLSNGYQAKMEWQAYLDDTNTSTRIGMGMSDAQEVGTIFGNLSGVATPVEAVFVYNSIFGGNWICITGNGAAQEGTDSGIPVTNTIHKFRIDIHHMVGAVGYYRFFIDDVFICEHHTNTPNLGYLRMAFGMKNDGGGFVDPTQLAIFPVLACIKASEVY